MDRKRLPSILSVSLALLLPGTFAAGETIRVVGSDYAGSALHVRAEKDAQIGPYDVSYQMTGSTLGLLKLKEGFADVAFVTQTSEGNPAMDGLTAIPLGFWGLYFAVHEDNPLNEVEVAVLSEIMRKTRDGLKSEWGSLLPTEPKWSNRLVFVTFDVLETDPSYSVLLNQFFEDEVLEKFSSMGERIENPYLSSASNLLIMSKLPIPGKGLRALALIESGQSIGYPPSAESLYFGDYPLRLSLYLLVRDVTDPKVRAFLQAFFESNQLELLENSGLVSAPENVQKQALLEFDLEF